MVKIVDSWGLKEEDKTRKLWLNAAKQFRMPYWDWARRGPTGEFGLPSICTADVIQIVMPGNDYMAYDNPLTKFVNPSGVAMGDESMGKNAIKDDFDVKAGWLPLPVSSPQSKEMVANRR